MAYLRMKRLGHDRRREEDKSPMVSVDSAKKQYSFIVKNPGSVSLTDGSKIKLYSNDVGKKVTITTEDDGHQTFDIEMVDNKF